MKNVMHTTKLSFVSLLLVGALLFGFVAYELRTQRAFSQQNYIHTKHIQELNAFTKMFDQALLDNSQALTTANDDKGIKLHRSWSNIRASYEALGVEDGAGQEFGDYYEALSVALGELENIQMSLLARRDMSQEALLMQESAARNARAVLGQWQVDDRDAYEATYAQNLSQRLTSDIVLLAGFALLLALLIAEMIFVKRKFQISQNNIEEASLDSQRNRLMLENAVSGVITIDMKGIIQSFNPAAEELFQYNADEVIGRNVSLLMPESHAVVHDNYLHSYMQTGVAEIIGIGRELQGRRKDGTLFPMDLGVAEMPLDDGRMFIGTVTDISSRKEAQEEAQRAKVMAERANKAKSEFLSSMSHELRTPLNAILGFGQILGDDDDSEHKLSEDQKAAVAHILKAGDHLITLIGDVLDLAKIECGKLTISIEDVMPQDIISGCISMSRAMAMKRGIVIEDRVTMLSLPHIRVDATRFKQVLLNLISNAIKYNKLRGEIVIESEQRLDGRLRITVSDTGAGIPKSLQDKLFVPFERLGHEGSQVEGSGIGLSITKELVNVMGGDVGFESEEGVGSKFWVDLPLSDRPIKTDDEQSTYPKPEDTDSELQTFMKKRFVGKKGAKKRLLYVEDNPANTQLMEAIVRNTAEYSLTSVTTAEDCLALLEKSPDGTFDMILMDINLPGIDGVEAARLIKANSRTSSIPIIAVSAAAMPSDIERAAMADINEYLTKPLNVKHTIEVLDRTLGAMH